MKKQLSTDEIQHLKKIGVSDSKNPSRADLEVYLKSLLLDKKISIDESKNFLKNNAKVTSDFLDVLKSVASDETTGSQQTIELINQAMVIIGPQLDRELSERERKFINKCILKLVENAREVDERSRNFRKVVRTIGGGVFVITAGVGVWIITRGRNPQIFMQGANIVARGITSFR